MIGYARDSRGYKLWHFMSKSALVFRDVCSDESEQTREEKTDTALSKTYVKPESKIYLTWDTTKCESEAIDRKQAETTRNEPRGRPEDTVT